MGGGVAQLINLVVYIGVLFNIGVGAGEIGLRLVVIIVADKVLHGVVGEELLLKERRRYKKERLCLSWTLLHTVMPYITITMFEISIMAKFTMKFSII